MSQRVQRVSRAIILYEMNWNESKVKSTIVVLAVVPLSAAQVPPQCRLSAARVPPECHLGAIEYLVYDQNWFNLNLRHWLTICCTILTLVNHGKTNQRDVLRLKFLILGPYLALKRPTCSQRVSRGIHNIASCFQWMKCYVIYSCRIQSLNKLLIVWRQKCKHGRFYIVDQ